MSAKNLGLELQTRWLSWDAMSWLGRNLNPFVDQQCTSVVYIILSSTISTMQISDGCLLARQIEMKASQQNDKALQARQEVELLKRMRLEDENTIKR